MARHGSEGTLWGRSSDGALGVSRVGWRAYFGCNGLWAPTYTPKCDTSETQLRHERNATATRAQRNCDGWATDARRFGHACATDARRMRDGWGTLAMRIRDGRGSREIRMRDGIHHDAASAPARPQHGRTRRARGSGRPSQSEPTPLMTAAGGPVRGRVGLLMAAFTARIAGPSACRKVL